MTKILDIAKLLMFVAIAAFFGVSTYQALHIGDVFAPTLTKLNNNLDELHRVTLEAGLTAMEARKASAMELKVLPQLTNAIQGTVAQSTATLVAVQQLAAQGSDTIVSVGNQSNALLKTANQTIADLQPVEHGATGTMLALQDSANTLNKVLANPAIPDTIANLDTTAFQLGLASTNIASTTGDVQKAVHAYLYPTWLQKLIHALTNGAVEAAKFFF